MKLPDLAPHFLPQATLPSSECTHTDMHLCTLLLSEEEKRWCRRGKI